MNNSIKGQVKSTRKMIILTILLIYIIYEPAFSQLFIGIHSYIVNVIAISALAILQYKKFIKMKKSMFDFFAITVCCAVYTFLITFMSGNEVRFFQHIYVIFQVLALYMINDYIDEKSLNPYEIKIRLMEWVIGLEFVITLMMVFIKPLKDFAIALYFAESGNDNEFVIAKRIFGVFGDYTFKCQIINGIFAFFFVTLAFRTKNKKYYLYSVMALMLVMFNGRTGILIFVIITLQFVILNLLKGGKSMQNAIKMLLRVGIYFSVSLIILYCLSPNTFSFLLNMGKNFLGVDAGNDNNLLELSQSIFFPQGYQFFFGSGQNYYGVKTDIGYCNDIGMVGLIVTMIEYLNLIVFLKIKSNISFMKIVSICCITGLLIANVKGVCMRSGAVIMGILWIKMILETNTFTEETAINS